jgi:hypothetical protein
MTVARLRSPIALLVTAALARLGAAIAPSSHATGGGGGTNVCTPSAPHSGFVWVKYEYEGGAFVKESTEGPDVEVEVTESKDDGGKAEPVAVSVTAPDGYQIVAHCVKAGNGDPDVQWYLSDPRSSVDIDSREYNHLGKPKAISHFTVKLVRVEEQEEPEAPKYPAPVCAEGVSVTYPEGSQNQGWNHVNVTVEDLESGEDVTLNFHNDADDWSGVVTFDPTTHADWPGWEHYAYTWVQVAGTNHHWGEGGEEPVVCGEKPEEPEKPTEPTLEGSIVSTDCVADAPWITYDVRVTPRDAELEDRTTELVLTDGTRTETIGLGEIGEDGTLSGRTLWPGAEVAADGVTPIAWPGWEQLDDGSWAETDGNFAWTRDGVTATLVVNPDLAVENFAYPPPTSTCANPPQEPEATGTPEPTEPADGPTTPAEPGDEPSDEAAPAPGAGDDELARTGGDVLMYALAAFVLLATGGTVLVMRRRA